MHIRERVPGSRFDTDTLTLKNTRSLRFALAVLILLYHSHLLGLDISNQMGYLAVSVFFFLSGYGLYESMRNKEGYLKTFIPKRYPAILVPFLASFFIALVIVIIVSGYSYFPLSNWWFVLELSVFYLIFFLSFLFLRGRNALISISVLTALSAVAMGTFLNYSPYYISFIGFAFGIFWSHHRERIEPVLRVYFAPVLLILLAIFFIPFESIGFGRRDIFACNVKCVAFILSLIMLRMLNFRKNAHVITIILLCALSLLFLVEGAIDGADPLEVVPYDAPRLLLILVILVILTKVSVIDGMLAKAGIISYEIYLIHKVFIYAIADMTEWSVRVGVSFSIVLSLITAYAVWLLSDRILKRYNRALDGYMRKKNAVSG